MATLAARRPSDLAFSIAIPPISHAFPPSSSAAAPSPTSPWHQYSQNPFGDSNGRRDSLTTPYRRTSTSARPALSRSMTSASHLPRHAKLHKRSDSAGSSATNPSGPQPFTMPSPIQDEFTLGSPPSTHHARHSSANKIKPYLRKMSLRDDDVDQGRLDLSRPSAENESLAGLGICDSAHVYARSVSDVSFVRSRRASHSRATSGPASLSVAASGPLRPTQPFAPLRQTPRSYTPPAGLSPSIDNPDDEAEESVGVLSNAIRQPDYEPWKPRRSISISSAGPAAASLSHTYTAGSLTKLTSASQSNLSIRSQPSFDQLKSSRTRAAARSGDYPTSPSARTSIDKAFSFLSRTSEPEDAVSRAAGIRAARRAYEEKEAAKERKYEKEDMKRRASVLKKEERTRRRSEVPRVSTASNGSNSVIVDEEKILGGTEYASQFPAHDRSLPVQGEDSGAPTSLAPPPTPSKTKVAKGSWNHFLAWTRTRLLNCGGKASLT